MATAYDAGMSNVTSSRFWTRHQILLVVCLAAVTFRLFTVLTTGGWADRSQFFIDGELRPGIIDFVFNEVLIYYLIIRVIIYKPNILVYTTVLLSSLVYYTRVPLILMFFAILIAQQLNWKLKFFAALLTLFLSFALLYLRIGEDLMYREGSSDFYITYALIGIGRLWQTYHSTDVTAIHYLTVFLKPLDAVVFLVDYIGSYVGTLSAGRFSGLELSRFEYIQPLQGAYNAFGTVLYPFIIIAGWVVGPILFILFLGLQHMSYSFATNDKILSTRYLSFILITGTFFSWTSPFAWLAPFIFIKIQNRGRTV